MKNKQKANLKANAAERDEYMNRKYVSNNSRVERRAKFKATKKAKVRDHYLYIRSRSQDITSAERALETLSIR